MRWLGALGLAMACAAPALAQDVVPEETFGVVNPEAPIALRDGVVLPDAEPVRFKGHAYTVRFVSEGGFGYTTGLDGTKGQFWTDLFLVGGTDDKMKAVAVYMKFCHGSRKVVDTWGDEAVPKLAATGEWAFRYPDDCAAWRKSHG